MSYDLLVERFFRARVHVGQPPRLWGPAMLPYTYGLKDGTYMFDLVKTIRLLERAILYVRYFSDRKRRFIFIGTKPAVSTVLRRAADKCKQYYVRDRWLPGTISNWGSIACCVSRLLFLRYLVVLPDFQSLGKRERASYWRQKDFLEASLSGVTELHARPDVAIVVDPVYDSHAVRECVSMGIKIVALVNMDGDVKGIDRPIPCNDGTSSSVGLVLSILSGTINPPKRRRFGGEVPAVNLGKRTPLKGPESKQSQQTPASETIAPEQRSEAKSYLTVRGDVPRKKGEFVFQRKRPRVPISTASEKGKGPGGPGEGRERPRVPISTASEKGKGPGGPGKG
jgi:small subunit ribosomal protein S2